MLQIYIYMCIGSSLFGSESVDARAPSELCLLAARAVLSEKLSGRARRVGPDRSSLIAIMEIMKINQARAKTCELLFFSN